jgi:4-hydroxybenzoate polyprenyltransferase
MSSTAFQHTSKKDIPSPLLRFFQFFFFGNYCYGFYAVALTIEACLQQYTPLNSPFYFLMIFSSTIIYYTYPNIRKPFPHPENVRVMWYNQHQSILVKSQILLTLLFVVSGIIFLSGHLVALLKLNWEAWLLLWIFPFCGILYYGGQIKLLKHLGLRKTGWLKPFVIGFVWAGLVTIYPIIFSNVEHGENYTLTFVGSLLFLKNFMFCSMLGIIGDIKDYTDDKRLRLETFVVRNGLFKTLFLIILPLSFLGLGTFIYYGATHGFHPMKIILNVFPFVLLMFVTYSLRKSKPMLFFFAIADGLLMVKAICGIIAVIYF